MELLRKQQRTPLQSGGQNPLSYFAPFDGGMLTDFVKPPHSVSSSSCLSTFEIKHAVSKYAIERLHERDDYELLPRWKRLAAKLVPITTMLSVGSYYLYFPYRIYCTRESSIKYNKTYILAWFFIVAEALVACKSSNPQSAKMIR